MYEAFQSFEERKVILNLNRVNFKFLLGIFPDYLSKSFGERQVYIFLGIPNAKNPLLLFEEKRIFVRVSFDQRSSKTQTSELKRRKSVRSSICRACVLMEFFCASETRCM